MPDALVYCSLIFIVGAYLALDLYLGGSEVGETAPEIEKDVAELQSKVNAIMLRDGFKIK